MKSRIGGTCMRREVVGPLQYALLDERLDLGSGAMGKVQRDGEDEDETRRV